VAEDVVWAKLRVLADGASIASRRLRRGVSRAPAKRRPAPKRKRAVAHNGRPRNTRASARKATPRRKVKMKR